MSEFLLDGLSADNVLAYLAALGTLRTADLAMPNQDIRMNWELRSTGWKPCLHCSSDLERDDLIGHLHDRLKSCSGLRAMNLADDLTLSLTDFRLALLDAQASSRSDARDNADFLAAFGSEMVQSQSNGKPTGQIADTAFRTMSGAGHQHFLGTMRTFINETSTRHLHKSMFETWGYDDPLEKHSLRWDPMDDIRYALRWANPSGDRNRKNSGSMWGANRLAIEALPLFPTQATGARLATTGFSEGPRQPTQLTWPVWSARIGLLELRSLLSLPQLQTTSPDHSALNAMGVPAVFRCQRITQGKYRNFTPGRPT